MFLLKEFLVSTFDLFFAVEVLGLGSLHDQFLHCIGCYRPFAAVGVIAGIARCAAAAGIICDHVINKVFITDIPKLMRLAWLKEKCVAWSNFGCPILVTDTATTGNDEVKLGFSRIRVIRTKNFTFGN